MNAPRPNTSRADVPRLGRGLASLLGEAAPAPAPGNATRTTLPVASLEPGPFQPRTTIHPDALEDLTASIRQQGVLQPILARPHPQTPNRWQIIGGERRWRAATAAGLHEIPVLIRALSDTEAMAAALVENLQREDLDAIEEAEGYSRLLDEFGTTQEQLAEVVGKSRSHIANTLRLLNLPRPVQGYVRSGHISPGHARALLGHADPLTIADQVIARGLNVRQTEALMHRPDPAPRPAPDQDIVALERQLSQATGLRVTITPRTGRLEGQGGSIQIAYRNLDQLDLVIDRLNRR